MTGSSRLTRPACARSRYTRQTTRERGEVSALIRAAADTRDTNERQKTRDERRARSLGDAKLKVNSAYQSGP